MRWLLLDTNAWIHLANGTGPLSSADRDALIRILTDRSPRRRFDVFTNQAVEMELILKIDDDPDAVWRAFDLVNLATNGRILLHTEDRLRREILQGGGHLPPAKRFVSGKNRARRVSAFVRRDIEQIRSYAHAVLAHQAQDPLDKSENVGQALADLERLSPGWREAWNKDGADAEVAQKFVAEHVEKYARVRSTQSIQPDAFPTAYWSVRIWTSRARRVIAEGGSPRAPGTFDHHLAVDAASYADILVGRDRKFRERIIDAVEPPFRHFELPAFCDFVLRAIETP